MEKRSWSLTLAFLVHCFFSHFTLLNMLVGILCRIISEALLTQRKQRKCQGSKQQRKRDV